MTDRVFEVRRLERRRVVGLNIGTSLDGIDAALIDVEGSGFESKFALEAFRMEPLPSGIVRQLQDGANLTLPHLARLHRDLGQLLGEAALHLMNEAGLRREDVHIIGSHGATVWHEPPRRESDRGVSWQVGDAAIIAGQTDALVVSNFRAADLAAGGQGAPLMPYLDFLLFRDRPGTLLLNLGGIANICYIGTSLEEVVAFDTGPANLPLNALAHLLSQGKDSFDVDGRLAAMGVIDNLFLDQLLSLPYISLAPPKSTGREEFGEVWIKQLLERNRHRNLVDILATMTAFVAAAVKHGVDTFLEGAPVREVVVSGGGVHNKTLMHHLRRAFGPVPVVDLQEHGHDPDAKEAILFGLLAHDRIFDHPTSLPSATGALWPVSLGQVS